MAKVNMAEALLQNNGSCINNNNLETFSLVWLDVNVNNNKENNGNNKRHLRNIINHLEKFEDEQACQEYIEQRSEDNRLVLVVSDSLGRKLVPQIHQLRQIHSIYVYCEGKQVNEKWTDDFTKIKAVTTQLDELITRIKLDQKKRMKEEQPLLINIFSTNDSAGKSTTGLNGQFVYSQLLIDCLLRMKSNEMDKNELISLCEREYEGNNSQLTILREFKHDYSSHKVLWWYSRDTFFYRVLNKALRVQNIEMLFLFRSYIYDIHYQLQCFQLKSSIHVYRSQLMASDEINSLKQNIGQFVSINSFLSTTVQRDTALFFLGDGTPTDDLKRVLFEIDADPRVVTTKPFADITWHSDFPIETEVLFMLGSIFRLNNMTLEDNQLWIIQMTLCSDDEHDLRQVLTYMKNQNSNGETDLRILAKMVWTMGKFDLAEKYYRRLINEIASNDPSLITLYEELGDIMAQKGDYDMSIRWRNKAVEIRLQNPPINDTNISVAVSSIELVEHQNPELEKIIAQSKIRSGVSLDEQKLIDQDMKIVVKQAMINKQCTKLSLSTNSITPNGALILANGLENNYTLEKLNLLENRIGDMGVRCLTKPLSVNNTVLKILHLGRNGITDDGAEHLAQMLKTNKTLTHLFLYTNEIANGGVAMLTNAIQNHNNTLECLNLSDNKLINDSSVNFLIEMVKHTRSLKTLVVHYCNLSKDSEETLRKAAQSNKNIKISVNSFWSFLKNLRSEI